ncbi:NAD(P)-binding protein [Canariomyces notabilis]|uniref:NAD(P)-binding protein n=1 Tax=Canariomyces notabilis TaxID=2074819 RepID=A0AAN6T7T9_9PEZI|nr:NAD(P)-binding protein [Canariomyces arenarius]
MATYLITGASRGLGLTIASILASQPESAVATIFAAARRDNSAQLKELREKHPGRVKFVQLDVSDDKSVEEAARSVEQELNGKGLDVLINNAGVMPWIHGGIEKMDDLNDTFNTNVTGVHRATRHFLPLLRKGQQKKVVNISSSVGSISLASRYQHLSTPSYKITKAALNALTVDYGLTFAKEGFTFIVISPGWLQTDLGGSAADLPVEVGAKEVVRITNEATKDDNGKFFDINVPQWDSKDSRDAGMYRGSILPW